MLVPLAEWARRELEDQADEILAKDRRNYTTIPGLYYFDILSKDQLMMRDTREMLTAQGYFDVGLKPGCYHRAWNPLAGTRPTKQQQYSFYADPWRQFSWESVGGSGGSLQVRLPNALREEVTSGCWFDTWLVRDPAGVTPPGQNYYYHLNSQQRCRIRSIMKAIPTHKPLARDAVRLVISRHYGIPVWVVARVANNHKNDVQ